MSVNYSDNKEYKFSDGPTIFLAGPTSCQEDINRPVTEWRTNAIQLFESFGESCLLIPEPGPGSLWLSYGGQVEWQHVHLNSADSIMFWIPRDMTNLFGGATNIEFGMYMKSGKVVLGCPPEAAHAKYMKYCAKLFNIPCFSTLRDTVVAAYTLGVVRQRWGMSEKEGMGEKE